jgi:hypothetical protein
MLSTDFGGGEGHDALTCHVQRASDGGREAPILALAPCVGCLKEHTSVRAGRHQGIGSGKPLRPSGGARQVLPQ